MIMRLIFVCVFLATAPCVWATNYYMAPASATPAGNDSNNGLTSSAPWLTPNHAVNCGDVILAGPGTYPQMMTFGVVTCAAGNSVARP